MKTGPLPLCGALCAALGAALLLLPAPAARGYSLIGGSLSLTQRDLRVYNNFSDASANDNTQADPNFPGYDGAELAVWKGAIEWASELHAGGFGDPTQPGGLGSGGANFDPTWQGNATSTGGSNDNVHSELSGSSGGTLAFTETPITNGWRIRYYSSWSWKDGPMAEFGGIDLQGVACHEYGHALGMGHSDDGGATMYPNIDGSGVSERSIEPDDIAGIKAIYGVKAANKAHIGSTSIAGGVLSIEGSNFSAAANEVWFTRSTAGGTGDPVKVTGVTASAGGTHISVTVPAAAGRGDVLVKNIGSTGSALSNPWPFDPAGLVDGGPALLGTVPAEIPAMSAGANTVTLNGAALAGTYAVLVDGIPAAFQNQSATSITFELPLVSTLGPVPIEVSTYLGQSSGSVTVVAPAAPVQQVTPPYLFTGMPITVTVGSAPGDVVFRMASKDLVPSVLPGVLDLAIGNGLATLELLSTGTTPPKAWGQQSFVAPPGLPLQTTLYFQSAVFEAANPVLPLVSTNVGQAVVVF